MVKKSLCLIFFIFLLNSIFILADGQKITKITHKFSGLTVTIKNRPIQNSAVILELFLKNQKKILISSTGKNGEFTFSIPPLIFQDMSSVDVTFFSSFHQIHKVSYTKPEFQFFVKQQSLQVSEKHPFNPQIYILTEKNIEEVVWNSKRHFSLFLRPIEIAEIIKLVSEKNLESILPVIKNKFKKTRFKYAILYLGHVLFEKKNYPDSMKTFEILKSNHWFNLKGYDLFKNEQYVESFHMLKKGILDKKRTNTFFLLAQIFEKDKKLSLAQKSYQQCIVDYNLLIKSLKFKWKNYFINNLNFCRNKLQTKFKTITLEPELRSILQKAGNYCNILEQEAIYYYNREYKNDKIYFNKKLLKAMKKPKDFFLKYKPFEKLRCIVARNKFTYDVQLISTSDKGILENRKLIHKNVRSSSKLAIQYYIARKAFYGPIGIIGFKWQKSFEYKIIGREKLFNEPTILLEANPKIMNDNNRLSGKIWINKNNGSILKIEWTPYRVKKREDIRLRSLIIDSTPHLSIITEFEKKKGNLRFPSTSYISEFYLKNDGSKHTRLSSKITYNKYRFFNVSMDTTVETTID